MLPPALQSELAGKRIFLTGGTGLFGEWILSDLLDLDLELVLLTRDTEKFQRSLPAETKARVISLEGDIRDFSFPDGDFDLIVHAATPVISDDLKDHPTELISVISDGTSRVLEFAKHCKALRLLYLSSGAVYAPQPPDLDHVPESHPCHPTTAYGRGKLMAESLCLESGIDSVIARCFSFVGPGMPLDAHFAIGNFIGNCLRNEPIIINGDGSPLRSYMYSSDLVEWLVVLLLRGKPGGIYNVGSEAAISISDLALKVREIAATGNPIEVRHPVVEGHQAERYVPSNKKATELLSLETKVALNLSIKKTLDAAAAKQT